MTRADQIRDAALGPTPSKPVNTHVWMGARYGSGEHYNGAICDDYFMPGEGFEGTRVATQRTFLLLVAEALE